jgi:hypothetical protein
MTHIQGSPHRSPRAALTAMPIRKGTAMQLVLTRYLDSTPDAVGRELTRGVSVALDAAASRVRHNRAETRTEVIDQGLRLTSGLDVLDGAEVRFDGTERLTRVEVIVPWSGDDLDGHKLLAANRFASSLADEVLTAA